MGVNAEAWVAHAFDQESLAALPELLNAACPAGVIWHWDSEPTAQGWSHEVSPTPEAVAGRLCMLEGPGHIVHVGASTMTIWSLARWRGFLRHDDLRERVRRTTAAIARALGATELVWTFEGACDLEEAGSATLEAIKQRLLTAIGAPLPLPDGVPMAIQARARAGGVAAWFTETVDSRA